LISLKAARRPLAAFRRATQQQGSPSSFHDSNNAAQKTMPYRTNDDLPALVQAHLPPHAQGIYREAFNHAFAAHMGDPRQEEAACRIAWAAVKRSYVKVGNSWIAREAHRR
jgi:cation transport regulator